MNHHTTYIKYLCYTCCAFFPPTPLIFFHHWTNLVAVCFTMKHHIAYKIPLLHLLRFFKAFSGFFTTIEQTVAVCFTMNQHSAHKIPLLHLLRFFFQTPLIFFHLWKNLVAVCFTVKDHTAYKIPLLHLLRFFRATLIFFLPLNRLLQFVSQ